MLIRLGLISAYSFLYGVHNPAKILDKAVSYGIKTVSICDINNLYGVHTFLEAAKERGIRPIIGAALTVNKTPLPPNRRFDSYFLQTIEPKVHSLIVLCNHQHLSPGQALFQYWAVQLQFPALEHT